MSIAAESDQFAKGMVAWSTEDEGVLDNYRLWQIGLISSYLGSSTIEIGAGNGRFAEAILERKAFERYVAVEPSDHFFEGLESIASNESGVFEVRQSTVDELAEDKSLLGKFDSVFSIHVMEHIEDDVDFVRKSLELIRPGGYLIALVPSLDFLYSELDRKIGHFRRYDRTKISKLAESVGAEVVVSRYDNLVGVIGWYWVCKIRGIDYHSLSNKKTLKSYFRLFSNYVLPIVSYIERVIPPPVGLNLTCVLRKPANK
jgi:2-polyprenyl-3-methyl-5-hydroxy-6-metoxy-1,4-benzoquinol methylase